MKSQSCYRIIVLLLVLALMAPSAVLAQEAMPSGRSAHRLAPATSEDGVPTRISNFQKQISETEPEEYFVQIEGQAVAEFWMRTGRSQASRAATQTHYESLRSQQATLASQVTALGGEVLADYQKVFNGLAVRISPDKVRDLMVFPGVIRVSPVPIYHTMLDETVPWVGAQGLQDLGFDGSGIRVAVIDSGIDYTHEHLGGSGKQADTAKAIAEASQPADPALFPTAKVIGGYDFVGSLWPLDGYLVPDPNPMDDQAGGVDGHGTHVASIIGGLKMDKLGPGVAPGVELYALKVCSSITSNCSGIAIQRALEWVADPNGDLFFDDRADVVNLSLGALYGQGRDAKDYAVALLSALGSVVVVSAGNSGNLPYVVASPSSARAAISVAQTTLPGAIERRMAITAPAAITGQYVAVYYPWSGAWTSTISGAVHYVGHTGCSYDDPMIEGVAGKIALIDRGICSFSEKIYNAQQAGAIAAIIGLVGPGEPFAGGQGSHYGDITIPGFNIAQAPGTAIKDAQINGATVMVTFDPTVGLPVPDTIVGTSSRGPRFDLNYIKPDISAPGASISASSGSQAYTGFGGTSGAAPMVSGAAALLLQAAGGSGSMPPHVVKARLMNNAVTTTWEDRPGGKLSPITRQGAGRLDVHAALNASTIAWVPADRDVALSYGLVTVAHPYSETKTIEVRNTSSAEQTYEVGVTYRYDDDRGKGVSVTSNLSTLTVEGNRTGTLSVTLEADPAQLRPWTLYGGDRFTDGHRLTDLEVDGFISLTETTTLSVTHLPFHFLPLKAADVTVGEPVITHQIAQVLLANSSPLTASVEVYALFDMNPPLPLPPNLRNVQPVDLRHVGANAEVWDQARGENLLRFAIGTYARRSHPFNVAHDIWLDIDQDGVDDYVAFNDDAGWLLNRNIDGLQVTALYDLRTEDLHLQFFLDSRLHSDNMVIPVVVPDDDLAFNFQIFSYDVYYGGLWDWSPAEALWQNHYHVFDANAPAFIANALSYDVGANQTLISTITMAEHRSPSQIGMLYRTLNGPDDKEMQAVTLPTIPAGWNLYLPFISIRNLNP
jgi:minor extracellular serine protease Vpr